MLALETESVLQAWALPIENISGVGGFVLALAATDLISFLSAFVRSDLNPLVYVRPSSGERSVSAVDDSAVP